MDDEEIKLFLNNVNSYVICSTLNQVVNFIPLPYISENKEVDIYNLTYESTNQQSNGNSNDAWDKNFAKVLNDKYARFCFMDSKENKAPQDFTYSSYENMIKNVHYKADRKGQTLWNITGGQRSFLLMIISFIMSLEKPENHWIVYVEGNKNQLIFGRCVSHKWELARLDNFKKDIELDTGKYLELAGFRFSNEAKGKQIDDVTIIALYKFTENYIVNNKLQKDLLATNTGDNKQVRMKKFKEIKELSESITNLIGEQSYPFGYLLEYMAYSVLYVKLNNRVKSITHNVKIVNSKDTRIKESSYCELDIVVLTKSGKLMIFECKSGYMSGENAKAREYTTYALGGVYGLPILITPIIPSNIECGEQVGKAINSAERAHMKYMDIKGLMEYCETLGGELS